MAYVSYKLFLIKHKACKSDVQPIDVLHQMGDDHHVTMAKGREGERKNGKNLDISIRGFVRSLFGVSLSSHDFLCCKYGS